MLLGGKAANHPTEFDGSLSPSDILSPLSAAVVEKLQAASAPVCPFAAIAAAIDASEAARAVFEQPKNAKPVVAPKPAKKNAPEAEFYATSLTRGIPEDKALVVSVCKRGQNAGRRVIETKCVSCMLRLYTVCAPFSALI